MNGRGIETRKTNSKKRYRKNLCIVCILAAFLIGIIPSVTVNADTGPKPSVIIDFKNIGNEVCYATLLSSKSSTGPNSVWNGSNKSCPYDEEDAWEAFVNFKDSDGFYYLQENWLVSETKKLDWTYYPPSPFKVLLYYPETGVFVESGIYERYAFHSYYTINMKGLDTGSAPDQIPVLQLKKSYSYTQELLGIIARIAITLVIELGIAFLVGFRKKQLILIILGTNLATQAFLNVMLNSMRHNRGSAHYLFCYLLLELLVFFIEAFIYCILFQRISHEKMEVSRIICYALTANFCSLVLGIALSFMVPGLF